MGRKTNTLITFLLALTCVTGAKKYADRSDRDPSTVWQPYNEEEDEGVFNSTVYGLEKGGDPVVPMVEEEMKTDFVTTTVVGGKGRRRQRVKRSLSSMYHDNEFHTAPPLSEAIDDASKVPVEDISLSTTPFPYPPPTPGGGAPLKGILRAPGPRAKSTKRVRFQRRPMVYFYNPRSAQPIQKCGGEDEACDGLVEEEQRCRKRPLKSTKWLRTGLRHLFYQ